jgi:phenylacetic acid degradation operon negative regulatory protein
MDDVDELLAGLRPLTARSVIATTLLGADGAVVNVGQLVRAGALFDIAEGAVRTALWRMVASGELTTCDGGYSLAGRLVDRRRRFSKCTHPEWRPWDGTWQLAVVVADRRPAGERLELRTAAAALHLGLLREGTWARPDNLPPGTHPHAEAVVDAQCARFRGAQAPAAVVGEVFDLAGWAARADALVRAVRDDRRAAGSLRRGFLLSIAVVRHLQEDPLLPDELLPSRWPGQRIRAAYEEYEQHYRQRVGAATRVASR